MFGQACIEHGIIAQTGDCCPGLTPWGYDANTGIAYEGFGCFNATFADVGQFAGPGGMDAGKCKPGLVAVNGKCAVPVVNTVPTTPLPPVVVPAVCAGTLICAIPNMWIYGGLAAVALLLLMGKKK